MYLGRLTIGKLLAHWRPLAIAGLAAVPLCASASAQQNTTPINSYIEKYENQKKDFNENTVVIVAGPTTGTQIKIIEDMQYVLDRRDTNEMRVLPVVGVSGISNMLDVLFLRNVDMGTTETGYFEQLKSKDPILFGDIDKKIHYIAKLYDAEFHFIAKNDIKSLEDLRGKKVSLYLADSSVHMIGKELFRLLGIDVEIVNDDQVIANEKLKRGEIAATARLVGAPTAAFNDIKPEDGIHFLPIDADSLSGGFSGKFSELMKVFVPGRLRSEHYPNLIPKGETVSTISNGVVLAVYAWPENSARYNRVARFVNAFFDNIEKFKDKKRNPNWQQTNLAAQVPGWTRFKAAQQWLDGKRLQTNNASATLGDTPSGVVPPATALDAFMEDYARKTGRPLTEADVNNLRQLLAKRRKERERN